MNIRLTAMLLRLRLSRDEAQKLVKDGQLTEATTFLKKQIEFGVRLESGMTGLELGTHDKELVLSVGRKEFETLLSEAPKKDLGIYGEGLALEIDLFNEGKRKSPEVIK